MNQSINQSTLTYKNKASTENLFRWSDLCLIPTI